VILKRFILISLSVLLFVANASGNSIEVYTQNPAHEQPDIDHDIPSDEQGEAYVIKMIQAPVSLLHLHFHADLSFEFDLYEISEETVSETLTLLSLHETKLYKRLFRTIISPNAP
jgi:hypothetical protein